MSLVELSSDNFEVNTLVLRPSVTLISSSLGLTGSTGVVARPSALVKVVTGSILETPPSPISQDYLDAVSAALVPAKNRAQIGFDRIDQPSTYTANFTAKRIITEVLSKLYRVSRQKLDLGYENNLCLSFRKSSDFPQSSVLIYPNSGSNTLRDYTPNSDFTIDFFVKPPDSLSYLENHSAGTILHISSTLAISLVTGSSFDTDGKISKFGICLQLSRSADISPDKIDLTVANGSRSTPQDLIFASPFDLPSKKWSRVTVRWSPSGDNGTGSIAFNNSEVTTFAIPSSSISTNRLSDALFVGNYYDGVPGPGAFFNPTIAAEEGLTSNSDYTADPARFRFNFPFYGEVHDLKIFKDILPFESIRQYNVIGDVTGSSCCFYLPPFFTSETRERQVLVSPVRKDLGQTDTPFSVDFSYNYSSYYINLENHVKEFVKQEFPRLYSLTGSTIDSGFAGRTADSVLYESGEVAKRNLLISSCDQSGFDRNYKFLDSRDLSRSYDAEGRFQRGYVSLQDYVTASYRPEIFTSISIPGRYTISDRLADSSSNQVCIFSISNLLYGDKIKPGTLILTDLNPTGSDGGFKITLQDETDGTLFRSDVESPNKSNTVGNVFYEEGLIFIKSPYLSKFGKDGVKIQLEGERRSNVIVINVPCEAGAFSVSPNSTYVSCRPTDLPYDEDESFVYITGMNLHDSNLNTIGRATFSQPIIKRSGQDLLFRVKYDI